MKRTLLPTTQFKKDVRRVLRRGFPESELRRVVAWLADDIPLADSYHDHALSGRFTGFRECHIRPDWLLVYRKTDATLTLVLSRTGSHSDLFKK